MTTVVPAAPVPGLERAFDVAARLGPLEDHGLTRAGFLTRPGCCGRPTRAPAAGA